MLKKEIKAVHDKDLETVLKNLNILDDINHGKKKCKFCDCIINIANLQALFPESGDIKLVCEKAECIKKMYEYLGEKGIG